MVGALSYHPPLLLLPKNELVKFLSHTHSNFLLVPMFFYSHSSLEGLFDSHTSAMFFCTRSILSITLWHELTHQPSYMKSMFECLISQKDLIIWKCHIKSGKWHGFPFRSTFIPLFCRIISPHCYHFYRIVVSHVYLLIIHYTIYISWPLSILINTNSLVTDILAHQPKSHFHNHIIIYRDS